MKFPLYFFLTIHLVTATTTSIAMELQSPKKEKTPNILTEITYVRNPRQALYLTESEILINGEECGIVNLSQKKCTKTFNSYGEYPIWIAVHPNKTKFALASLGNKITIYNAQTYKTERTINPRGESLLFSPLDDIIAINDNYTVTVISLYTSKTEINTITTETFNTIKFQDNNRTSIISFHPTQPLMCIARASVYIYNPKELSIKRTITSEPTYPSFCTYSPDGSYIARGNSSKIIIDNEDNDSHKTIHVQREKDANEYNSYFTHMAIHPNNKTLITTTCHRSTKPHTLTYWDVNTAQPIATMDLPFIIYNQNCLSSTPSFSPSGKKLLIVVKDYKNKAKCFELEVPFEVIARATFPYLWFLLKNIKTCDDETPQDIKLLIANILLKTYKRT